MDRYATFRREVTDSELSEWLTQEAKSGWKPMTIHPIRLAESEGDKSLFFVVMRLDPRATADDNTDYSG
jgi:hypothetical protein